MTGWTAYYTEDRVFCCEDYSWSDIPDDGVLAVLIFEGVIPGQNRRYRKILQGNRCEWYFMVGGSIHCSEDKIEEIQRRYPNAEHFKRGKWAEDWKFEEVIKQAQTKPCGCD